ncbi:MAG: phosphatase PAP2 family protein, partial [Anaerolineales bacterium]|nr:phosphatase PAP2 family protein [Anaerolineales bacterium]
VRKIVFSILLTAMICNLSAGEKDSLRQKVYHLNYYVDVPVTTVSIATAFWGFAVVDKKPPLDSLTIIGLDANNINRFDRSATWQDPEFAPISRNISDVTLGISNALPLLLLLNDKIRQDWADVLLLFLETQAIVGNLYSWASVVHIDRIRPLVYNPDIPWDEKTGARTKNAFYSGHTSLSASASFFTAKVYCDYHPELGNKKFLIYSLALIPPVATGFFRYKGLKHFPTDVITGVIVGASAGILIPHLHKKMKSNLVVVPFAGQVNGLALSYKF